MGRVAHRRRSLQSVLCTAPLLRKHLRNLGRVRQGISGSFATNVPRMQFRNGDGNGKLDDELDLNIWDTARMLSLYS